MTIKKPVCHNVPEPSQADIERVIDAGSPLPGIGEDVPTQKEVKFQMVIPADLCQLIDDARRLTKTSRRTWLLQAAQEKLAREGRL